MARADQATTVWRGPWLVVLGVIALLVLALLFVVLAGSRLSRRYHKGKVTVRQMSEDSSDTVVASAGQPFGIVRQTSHAPGD